MGKVLHLPARRTVDPVSAELGEVSARLFYLARDLRCVAAHHSRDPAEILVLCEWMTDAASEFGEIALGDLEG